MATIKQVSELANVSSATVSRVINNPESVKLITRSRVLDAITSLGYRHNAVAASLASSRTHSVGYLVPELHGSFYGEMMAGTEAMLRSNDKHMIITTGHSDEKIERAEIETLISRRCDALILHVEALSDEYLVDLSDKGVQFVLVNRYIEEIKHQCISLDNRFGGYIATNSLIKMGHRYIGYICGAMSKHDSRERLKGHMSALDQSGISPDQDLIIEGDFSSGAGFDCTNRLLSKNKSITAIVCGNDEMAAGTLSALRKQNIKVPGQVSVVGFDNVEFSSYLHPQLTTIDYPRREIGEMAAKWILNTVYEDKHYNIQHIIQPTLITRHSCSPS